MPLIKRTYERLTKYAYQILDGDAWVSQDVDVLIPAALRSYAGLDGAVIVAGAGEWLEIWNPERFEEEMTAATDATEQES